MSRDKIALMVVAVALCLPVFLVFAGNKNEGKGKNKEQKDRTETSSKKAKSSNIVKELLTEKEKKENIEQAKTFLSLYNKLGDEFDPAIADCYSDKAKPTTNRIYPNGKIRTLTLTGEKFKKLIVLVMPLAKARNDKSRFSDISYHIEGDGVRIKCKRYSNIKNHTGPHEILIRPTKEGKWIIVEEITESLVLPRRSNKDEDTEAVFKKKDKDSNGKLSWEEFKGNYDVNPETMEERFNKWDTDGGKSISLEEFKKGMKKKMKK